MKLRYVMKWEKDHYVKHYNEEDLREWFKKPLSLLNPEYFTKEELEFPREEANLQAVLGIQTCKTKGDVCHILNDIRLHEKYKLLAELKESPRKRSCLEKEE